MKKISAFFLLLIAAISTSWGLADGFNHLYDPTPEPGPDAPLHYVDPDPDGSVYPFTGSDGRACTLMIYMTGTNLESDKGIDSATKDMKEMVTSGYDQGKITILLMAGGTTKWKNDAIDSNDAAIYELVGNTFVKRKSLGKETNMGEAATLSDFLKYGVEHYPAISYVLDFWDHGGGPLLGVMTDDFHSGDGLLMDELTTALADTYFFDHKLSLLSFHTCLQGSTEVAEMIAPYADYMLASEEVSSTGFDYNYAFVKGLENDASGVETAKRVIDMTYDQRDYEGYSAPVTFAVTDLSKMKTLTDKVGNFFGEVDKKLTDDTFGEFSRMRADLYVITYSDISKKAKGTYDLVDLGELTDACSEYAPNQAKELKDALYGSNGAIVYRRNKNTILEGTSKDWSSGLSVYFPYYNQVMFEENKDYYAGLGFSDQYVKFINDFQMIMSKGGSNETDSQLVSPNWASSLLDPAKTSVERAEHLVLQMNLTEEQVAELLKAELVVLQKITREDGSTSYVIANSSDAPVEGTTVKAEFVNRGLFAVDAQGNILNTVPLSWERTSETSCKLEVTLTDAEGDQVKALLFCTIGENGVLSIDGAFAWDETVSSYASGIALDLSRFKTMTASVNAISGDWETVETYTMEWPADSTLCVMDDKLDLNSLLYAFRLTDIYLNQHISTMKMVNPDENIMILLSSDDTYLLLDAGTADLQEDGSLLVTVSVENPNEAEIVVYVTDVCINDSKVPVEGLETYITGTGSNEGIPTGQKGTMTLMIPASALENLNTFTSITMKTTVINAETEEVIAETQGTGYKTIKLK